MLCTVLLLGLTPVHAADLTLSIVDAAGHGVAGVVLVAQPDDPANRKRASRMAVMDQIDMQFVPDIVVIQTGSSVDFPNSDQIQHQVYSFSAPKQFQLSLYEGHKYPPVVFDRPGVVTVGCNIHDGMLGHIYVTDSPFFGKSDARGRVTLQDLPAGSYTLIAWHPQLQSGSANTLQLHTTLAAIDHGSVTFRVDHPISATARHHESKRWADY